MSFYVNPLERAEIYSVSELNLTTKAILEEAFPGLWVKGEISNFSCPQSGHWYFTLKDPKSQIRCAMFRGHNWKVNFQPASGNEVTLLAKVSLYTERGDYQLIAEQMLPSGEGQLRVAYDALKQKLAAEGLFASTHKQALPLYPNHIGLITSATGAAIRDILSVLQRRYPKANVWLYPCLVQGNNAAADIIQALELAHRHGLCEVLILARGGGSLEDLWPFNEESVARAIFKSQLPIISGVGHETDFSIADFVADQRAPTPSVAAETVVPDYRNVLKILYSWEQALHKTLQRQCQDWAQTLDYYEKRLIHPGTRLRNLTEQLTLAQHRLNIAFGHRFEALQRQFNSVTVTFEHQSPLKRLAHAISQVTQLENRLHKAQRLLLTQKSSAWLKASEALELISPMATLTRGYSITYGPDQKIIRTVNSLNIGDWIQTYLQDGVLHSQIQNINQPHFKGK